VRTKLAASVGESMKSLGDRHGVIAKPARRARK